MGPWNRFYLSSLYGFYQSRGNLSMGTWTMTSYYYVSRVCANCISTCSPIQANMQAMLYYAPPPRSSFNPYKSAHTHSLPLAFLFCSCPSVLGTHSTPYLSLGPRCKHSSVRLIVNGLCSPLPMYMYPCANIGYIIFLSLIFFEYGHHVSGVHCCCCSIMGIMSTNSGRMPTKCTLPLTVSADFGQSKRSSTWRQ